MVSISSSDLSQLMSLGPLSDPTNHRNTWKHPGTLTALLNEGLGRKDVGGINYNLGGLQFHITSHCLFYQSQNSASLKCLGQSVYGRRKLYGLLILFMPFCIKIIGFSDHWFCTYIHTTHFINVHTYTHIDRFWAISAPRFPPFSKIIFPLPTNEILLYYRKFIK